MLFDLFAATDRPEFLTVRPDGRDTAEATADGMDRDGRDYLRGLGRLRRLTPFARDLASGDCRSSVLLGDLTAEYQSAAITPYWGPWRVPCPFRRGFRAGAWGRGALWGARPVEGYW
ncbi:hypothetical protein GCM10010430_73230 [Kitasatospora cystarginea]|uniref:Uncharacterized protein n=2 Tax=Streptomycetaceae TaxID=2062 RepID=A0ABN3EXV1_9ACTN